MPQGRGDEATTPEPSRYEQLATGVDLPALEEAVLRRWAEQDTFQRSLKQREGAPRWVFYEGPPTANGMPGIHHVEARSFKDTFPRYKTMRGFRVDRRAGWDCHGLPVELEVEKRLGFTRKQQIEDFGIAEFNARCRESVLTYVDAWTRMSERMGYWVDFDHAYLTMDPAYVESLWWALARIHERGLLVEDHRVAPYCPRCQTALSSHELGQPGVYVDITSPSAYVRFPLTAGDWAGDTDLLVWTTTPWTLISNTAVAVHPEVTYVRASRAGEDRAVIVAEALLESALGEGWQITDRFAGSSLERLTYARPFELLPLADANYVVLADFVTTEDGTGLVHLAPAFGADDLAAGRAYGLPVVNPLRPDGTFEPDLPRFGGLLFTEADPLVLEDLTSRGLLARHQPYDHPYPHCWRCHHALVYYAMPSWYIRTTAIKDRLLAANEQTNWFPAGLKHGRYGDWLTNNVDWALSRSRYWGTPLPIWRCADGHQTCVESLARLGALTGQDMTDLDPHRPYVDAVTFDCPQCGATATRVPDVIDVWFDSGAMPFAQFGAPHRDERAFQDSHPAQFICEAIDQTRGWFYTLMAIGALVFDRSPYENVVTVGLLLDAEGRKMSKHIGNVLEPVALMDRHGADAVRWFMLASGSPANDRRIGHEALDEIVRRVLLTYWNTVAFQTLYGAAADWDPTAAAPPRSERPVLDRWLRSELARLVGEVETAMESFDTQGVGRLLGEFIDSLSNWYVRRSRRRFWRGDASALATLHECLNTLTRLLAPLVPFITERVWQALVVATDPTAATSVHLADWPAVDPHDIDSQLATQVRLTRRIVEVGRAARAGSGVKVRQPLAHALVAAPGLGELSDELRAEICEELNVERLDHMGAVAEVVDYQLRPQFRALGKRFGARTQQVAQAIRAHDPQAGVATLRATDTLVLTVDGEPIEVGHDEVEVCESPRTGWYVASEGAISVALNLEITPTLRRRGIARDVVRLIQRARKDAGLHISDRITVRWQADGETAQAITENRVAIADEVLAVEFDSVAERPGDAELAGAAGRSGAELTGTAGRSGAELTIDEELGLRVHIAATG